MSEKLELIKDLRAKGASIKMIDDVAQHLETYGGYSSPVFVATVEFILKLKNMLLEYLQEKETVVSVADQFTQKETANVNFNAARETVRKDDELDENQREKIERYIAEIETAQLATHVENNNYKALQNEEIDRRLNNNPKAKRKREEKRNQSLLEKLFNVSVLSALKTDQQKKQQEQNKRQESQRQQQQVQQQNRQNQQQHSSQAVQQVQRSSITKMNLLKMKLMNTLKIKKDYTVIGQEAWKAKKASLDPHAKKEAENASKYDKKNQKYDLLGQKSNVNKEKKASTEISISKVIDEAVKKGKPQKIGEEKPTEKGKHEAKVGEKAGPKADEKKVAEMAAKEAITKLQQSGVTTSSTDAKSKKEIDHQVAQAQAAGGGATHKLQR